MTVIRVPSGESPGTSTSASAVSPGAREFATTRGDTFKRPPSLDRIVCSPLSTPIECGRSPAFA